MTNKKTMKTIVFSLGLAAMTLTATNLNAQNRPGGMFGSNQSKEASQGGLMKNSTRGVVTINDDGYINNQGIGQEAPLGSGLLILLGAGLGYVALKKKED
ncbi:MAG: hypothetical protein J6P83_03830 [Bacteroidales bacterium]|nr:hypothetical protein [Bacteroidales bacterium]